MFESRAENIDGNNDIIGNSGNRNKKISPNKGTKTKLAFLIFINMSDLNKKYPRTRGRKLIPKLDAYVISVLDKKISPNKGTKTVSK